MKIERATLGASSTHAWVGDDGDVGKAIGNEVLDQLRTQLNVTIGGHTMHLAAWEDPEHWSEDWAKLLEVDPDDVRDVVDEILQSADEDTG
jgi:hypothetical protein